MSTTEWTECIKLLQSDTSSTRKARRNFFLLGSVADKRSPAEQEGAKQALSLLDADKVGSLDAATRRHPDSLKGTWAGLAAAIAQYVTSELGAAKGRKTALANTVSSLFRKCIRKAEEPARVAALGHPLLASAPELFERVFKAMIERTATPQLMTDYTTTLREVLLPVPAYCLMASEDSFMQLVALFMRRLSSRDHDSFSPEEMQRMAAALAELLRRCPHDLQRGCWEDCLDFFVDLCESDESGESVLAPTGATDARTLSHLFAALNVFLLKWGADVAHDTHTLKLLGLLAPILQRAWSAQHVTRKIKDECFAVARTLLNLEILGAVPGLLQATLDAAVAEVEHRAADSVRLRGDSHEQRGPPLGEEARLLMELISDLWAHRASDGFGWRQEPDANADDVALPRKRARTLDPWAGTVLFACNSQPLLLPALALALRRHGETMPQHLLSAAFPPLWACLRNSVHADRAVSTAAELLVAIWVIRCLRRIAVLSAKRACAADDASGSHEGTGTDAAYSWPEVAELLRAWMTSPGAGGQGDAGLLMSESLELWSVLIACELAPPPRSPEQLLGVKQLSEVNATSLVAVAAFFSRPSGGFAGTLSETEHRARQRGVAWVLQALAPQQQELIAMTAPRQTDEPPNVRGAADVLRALCLGLCPTPEAVTAAATPWWQDDAKEHSRRLIRRGVEPVTVGQTAARPPGCTIPSMQSSRLALPVAKALLTLAGQTLSSALDSAWEAAHIFALMAVAAEIGTAAAVAVLPEPPPDVWCASGTVALSSASALERAQAALMERSPPARLFTPRLLAASCALGAAAALEPQLPAAPVDPLGDTVLQLRHALLAAATALQAAVTTETTTTARLADDLFFDEGDFGQLAGTAAARVPAATQRAPATLIDPLTQMAATASTGSALAVSGDPLEVCVGVIAALGIARPLAAAESLISLLGEAPDALPESAQDAVLTALCGLRGAPSRALGAAMSALGGELEHVKSHQSKRIGWLLRLATLAASVQLDFKGRDSEMPDADASAEPQPTLHTAHAQLCSSLTANQMVVRACGVSTGVALVHATYGLVLAVRDCPDCLANLALNLVADPRYAVRCAMVSRFGELLSTFTEEYHQAIMRDVCRLLAGLRSPAVAGPEELVSSLPEIELEDKARQETTLLLLGEAAVASGPLEAACVYDIISLAVDQPCHVPMALRVLTATAKRMGYADRFALIEHHVAFIAHHWTVSGRNVDSLVHAAELLAPRKSLANGRDIVRSYARFLLPRLVECNDVTSVSRVAELCGLSNRELFLQHGARTLAALHAFRINGGDAGKVHFRCAFENDVAVIKAAFTTNVMEIFKNEWPLILRELLRMVPAVLADSQPDSNGAARVAELQSFQPSMSMAATLAAVYDVEAALNRSVRIDAQTVLWSPDVVAEHLVFIHGTMDRAKSARHRIVALNSLSVLLQLIEKHRKFDEPSTFRYAVHLLLEFATAPSLQILAISLLDRLTSYALALNSEDVPIAQVLGDVLWRVVSRLVACAQAEATAPSAIVMQLLRKLVLDAPRWLLPRVAELDPFPVAACFDELRKAHEALSQNAPLPGRLSRFCERARSMQPGARRLAAQALLAALRAPGAVARTSVEAALITSAVWQLARLCEEADDDAMRELAAAALALVGSPDPFAIAFHSTTVATSPIFKKPARSGGAPAEDATLTRIALRALSEYLVDPDHRIVSDALTTCKALLATPAGAQALNDMEPSERIYLAHLSLPPGDGGDAAAGSSTLHAAHLEDDSLWSPPAPGPHYSRRYDAWLCKLTHALLSHARGGTLRLCHGLAGRKSELAALLLPYAFADIAADAGAGVDGTALRQLLSRKVEAHILRNPAAGARATHALLECLAFLRNMRVQAGCVIGMPSNPENRSTLDFATLGHGPTSWATIHWLDIDYLCVARAALSCGACFTALQYVEYWCEDAHGMLELGSVDSLNDAGPLPAHVAIALEAHAMCGETDGIYGILRAPHVTLQLRRAEHEGAWGRSLAAHDAVLGIGGSGATSAAAAAGGVLRSIQRIGCNYVLDAVAAKLCRNAGDACSSEFREAQMQAAWRAGRWADLDGSNAELALNSGSDGFHACFASALLATSAGEVLKCSAALSRGRASVMRGIALTGAESAASINTAIVHLQLLDEVSDVTHERWGTSAAASAKSLGEAVTKDLMRRWDSMHTAQHGGRFDLLEPLLAGRSALFNAVGSAAGAASALTAAAAAARMAGMASAGLARIHAIKIACAAGSAVGGSTAAAAAAVGAADALWRDEEAALLWMDGQHELALGLAGALVGVARSGRGSDSVKRTAALLSCLGGWLAERHAESTDCIRSQHLEKAVKLLTQAKASSPGDAGTTFDDALCHAHFQLAQFLDSIQRGFEERVTSTDWSRGQQLLESTRNELMHRTDMLRAEKAKSAPRDAAGKEAKQRLEKALARRIASLQRNVNTDEPKRALIKAQHEDALLGCLAAYGSCLSSGDSHDMTALFRLVALWFKSAHNQGVNALLSSHLVPGRRGSGGAVPSAKMLPLVWQLVARLESEQDASGFQHTLHAVVGRLARDHPFHSLYQLLALRAANVVGQEQLVSAPTSKIAAATELLDGVRAASPRLASVLSQMETLVGAYVKVTEMPKPTDRAATSMPLPGDVRRLPALDKIPIITAHLPVDPACAYPAGSFPTLHKMPAMATLPGGVNVPRKLDVLASDGQVYPQLAKGKDDLRQDAVMQQVFGHASALLRSTPGARARGMRMHTYKVIPFNPTAGLVEWCVNTRPLSDYLVRGARSAHRRLRPEDITNDAARLEMELDPPTFDRQRAAYAAVCSRFKPVMHHFFLESFHAPSQWYERRLAYTRSVAVSSMVGYIIGLGDRHSSNILIGCQTGELVHIDLGVAFDQGELLPTPETVPFRLTRDIVDGCGAAGVEGVLRRCCEESLSVLRANKESLVTLIEVLIHDPILRWAMSPELARRHQGQHQQDADADEHLEDELLLGQYGAQGVQNADAERALLRVRQKLDGVDDGQPRPVEAQVQQLLQTARDPDKLCRLFPGWAAWV